MMVVLYFHVILGLCDQFHPGSQGYPSPLCFILLTRCMCSWGGNYPPQMLSFKPVSLVFYTNFSIFQ